ncbi:MAG: hypothetical protein QOF30_147 [Acidimicrobiaceae bacterium]|jgi:hypothetical protein|nr:hypothetical protein [Acidimicrobiaceae bacterium]
MRPIANTGTRASFGRPQDRQRGDLGYDDDRHCDGREKSPDNLAKLFIALGFGSTTYIRAVLTAAGRTGANLTSSSVSHLSR